MKRFNLSEGFVTKLEEKKITEPTKVQISVIPELLDKKNIIFQSDTGTGKTLAFLLPLLQLYSENDSNEIILVISPTHELSSQIKAEVQSLGFKSTLCIGGSPIKRQIESLKDKPKVIVGGASRILELIYLKKVKLERISAIVLDEIDRLFSPELRDDVGTLLSKISNEKIVQIVGCSATIKPNIMKVVKTYVPENFLIEEILLPSEDIISKKIKHIAIYAETRDKVETLRSFIAAEHPRKTLVFTSRPQDVEVICSKLQFKKVPCEALHSKADKVQRKAVFDRFKSGKCSILITSDLACRGLDIPDISHIVQMDFPANSDFFIHRAGRTARAGKEGTNLVIGDGWEMKEYSKLEKKLGIIVYPAELHNGKLVFLE